MMDFLGGMRRNGPPRLAVLADKGIAALVIMPGDAHHLEGVTGILRLDAWRQRDTLVLDRHASSLSLHVDLEAERDLRSSRAPLEILRADPEGLRPCGITVEIEWP